MVPKEGWILICSDECAIYRSSRAHNVVFWSEENPHFTLESEHHLPHVMTWAGMTSRHIFGPIFFFDGPVNSVAYDHILRNWLVAPLVTAGIAGSV